MQTNDKSTKVKKEKTLRQSLIVLMLLAVAFPMLCLTVISQLRIWKVSEAYMNEIIASDIQAINTSLDMVLDKYATVLYDFCVDEDTIQLVEGLDRNKGKLDTNNSRLRRKLSNICERNEGVEGITLITVSGQVIFYDRRMDSTTVSTWAGQVTAPEIQSEVVYQDTDFAIQEEKREIGLYQVARRIMDYQNVGREIGTVVLSINADTLRDATNTGENSDTYICKDGQILSSAKPNCPEKKIAAISMKNQRVISKVNERSGWTVYKYYAMDKYSTALRNQTIMLVLTSISMALFLIGAIWHITNPMLIKVDGLIRAMGQVEEGDLTVQVSTSGRIPKEVRLILDMFNSMVKRLYQLIDQVKQSAIDQKNAEISAMEAQIDPHFLYNTLDTINWKALEKDEYEISSMVGALADILRYSIRNPGDTVSIGQALYWMEQYTMLQSKKLEAPLELIQDASEEIKTYRIHKLLIQPFVENAIRHGFHQKKETCKLEVTIRLAEEQLHIVVKDNGRGISPEELAILNDELHDMAGHVGVNNARKRMQLYYGKDATVYFESKEGCYTKAHIFVKAIHIEGGNV